MFEQCRISLEQYVVVLRRKAITKRADHLLQEVRARLRELPWLHARLVLLARELEEEGRKAIPADSPKPHVLKKIVLEESTTKSDPEIQARLPFQKSVTIASETATNEFRRRGRESAGKGAKDL